MVVSKVSYDLFLADCGKWKYAEMPMKCINRHGRDEIGGFGVSRCKCIAVLVSNYNTFVVDVINYSIQIPSVYQESRTSLPFAS